MEDYNKAMAERSKQLLGNRHCLSRDFNNPRAVAASGDTTLTRWLIARRTEKEQKK